MLPTHFLVSGVQASVPDILQNGAMEQPGVLQNHAEPLPEHFPGHIPDIHAVHLDAALGDIIKAHDQIDNGGLAGTGFAHQGHLLTRLH